MDNLGSHKGREVRASIEAVGAKLLYLPPYRPNFNPIENAFYSKRVAEAVLAKGGRRVISVGRGW